MEVKICICCNQDVEVTKYGTPKGHIIGGNLIICEKCCDLLGIPTKGLKGIFIAATYTEETALKKYAELNKDIEDIDAFLEERACVIENIKKTELEAKKRIKENKKAKSEAKKRVKNDKLKNQEKFEMERRKKKELKSSGYKEKTEEKYTCTNCQAVWYVNDTDMLQSIHNITTSTYTLGMAKDITRCPKCGSRASTHKKVSYWVDKKGNCVYKNY